MRTLCQDCEGKGIRILPRMAVLTGGRPFGSALAQGEFVTGFETQECKTCDASGWVAASGPPV